MKIWTILNAWNLMRFLTNELLGGLDICIFWNFLISVSVSSCTSLVSHHTNLNASDCRASLRNLGVSNDENGPVWIHELTIEMDRSMSPHSCTRVRVYCALDKVVTTCSTKEESNWSQKCNDIFFSIELLLIAHCFYHEVPDKRVHYI